MAAMTVRMSRKRPPISPFRVGLIIPMTARQGASMASRPPPRLRTRRSCPGFMMLCGIERPFRARASASSASAPCSASRYFILPWPTPCSPVQVPSMASARSTRRSMKASPRAISVGVVRCRSAASSGNCRRRHGRRSARAGRVASMSLLGLGDAFGEPRDRHADVGRHTPRAGPQRLAPPSRRRAAPATAACGPPACVAQSKSPPPNSAAISPKRLGLLLRRRPRVPWNSRNSSRRSPASSSFE